jgi:predicted oxidoreductase
VSKTTIAAAWILRHPANIQLIAGTMNREHMAEIVQAAGITLSREEWYQLYLAAGHILP